MKLCEVDYCDFVVWRPDELVILRIPADDQFTNRSFHFKVEGIHYAQMTRDITAGVHSCAILWYKCMAVNGNSDSFRSALAF